MGDDLLFHLYPFSTSFGKYLLHGIVLNRLEWSENTPVVGVHISNRESMHINARKLRYCIGIRDDGIQGLTHQIHISPLLFLKGPETIA